MTAALRAHRAVAMLLILALVAVMGVAPADAKKKKKKKKKPPVSVDVEFFLGSTGCPAGEDNVDYLTLTDTDDAIECWYTAAGARNDVTIAAGQSTREAQSRYWDTIDGVPLVLDTAKPITGEIFTSGPQCVVGGAPCSPAGVSLGEVILEITIVGTIAGEDIELGSQVDTFEVLPTQMHTTAVEIEIDPTAAGKQFDVLQLVTWVHGNSVGHGVIKTQAPASSFVIVPSLVPAT